MKKIILSALTAAAILGSNSAFADDKLNPWRDCGIGAMIFPTVPAGAVISNIIWDWGTTAVTSNASSPDTCEGETVKVAQFIEQTFAPLEEQTANGNGQHVTAMLNILGCNANTHNSIIKNVRTSYAKELASSDQAEKPQALYRAVIANTQNVCSAS